MGTRGNPRPLGVPGPHLCRNDLSALRPAPHKCRPGSPGRRDAVCSPGNEGGRRRTIGVVAALPASHARPRRWCGAGSPGRQSVTAAQKAGDEGRNPRSHKTHYPALSRQRPAGFNNPDGQAGSPPPQCPPNLKENRDRGRWGPAETHAPSGCRVRICAGTTSRRCGTPGTNADRAPPGGAMRSALPATREAAGAPSAWSQPSPPPTRDHADGATLGRQRRPRRPGTRAGTRDPTRPNTPHSLGNARPASTTLTGRLEARPHNVRPT